MAKLLSKLLVGVALLSGSALAQNAKVSIQMTNLSQVSARTASADGYSTVLRGEIQTARQKDLVVGVSLESGLYTDTTVVSKNLQADRSVAMARILVRVVVDDSVMAYPGVVTFAEREQGLVARFAGYFECTDLDGDGITTFGECDYTKPEELQLWLKTLNANAFFFAMPDSSSRACTRSRCRQRSRPPRPRSWAARAPMPGSARARSPSRRRA